jgi:thiamine transport system ATP-binding protein
LTKEGAGVLHLENLLIRQGEFSLTANWTLARGQKLAIIGPSGGGKSTLLMAIAGLIPIADGRIHLNGLDVTDLPPAQRPASLLFQDHNLFPHLSVGANVGLGLRPDLKLSRAQWQQVDEVLSQVGLDGLRERQPAQLSGGQRQRTALARALLRNRPVLMLDEPFAALGPALKSEMLELVNSIVRDNNLTLVMVTHDPSDAQNIAGITALVSDGIAHAPRETDDLFANQPRALAQYLGNETR